MVIQTKNELLQYMNDLNSGSLNYHFLKINIFCSSEYLFCTLKHGMSVFSLCALQFEKYGVAFGLKPKILINNEIFEFYNKNSNFFQKGDLLFKYHKALIFS